MGHRPSMWWAGLLLPGGGQLLQGQWLTALLVLWTVPYLIVTALADLAASQGALGLVDGALATLRSGQVPPQPLWTVVLALAVHVGSALWARRPAP